MSQVADVEVWSGKDRGDENFPVGSVIIRRALRPHVHAYYSFARNADDIADSPTLRPDDKIARLDTMEDVLLGHRDGGSPSAIKLRESLAQTGVSAVHATDLLIAFRRDAVQRRYMTIDDLYNYCRYSAVPVGRYVLDLHGESHECYSSSDALCIALQVLNHMQDCAIDLAQLDRCYLPQSLLDHFGVKVVDLRLPAETPALRRVFVTLLDRIDRLTQAAAELPEITRDKRLKMETAAILRLARRLARRLALTDPLASRVKLTRGDFALSTLGALRHLL
ncbi:MAG: squalene synthase HpnC [Acetobacteraceae bacterium]|nr:squalene synthase HpnC [Acetobacteraceae bacterium]